MRADAPQSERPQARGRVGASAAALGTRIQALRIERGLTQEQLAQLSGVSRNVLMDVEHGRRGILHERLFDIAKALGVSAADLLEGIRKGESIARRQLGDGCVLR